MYKILFFFFIIFLFSCDFYGPPKTVFRNDFTTEEIRVMQLSDSIIHDCYYGTFITLDKDGNPRARVMEPFAPEKDFIIWLATNPKSRKVVQLTDNTNAVIHYFDKATLSYVSLMGNAYLIDDEQIKKKKWKPGWEAFYPNRKENYILIKFIPDTLEMISILKNFNGDQITWKPHQVILRK